MKRALVISNDAVGASMAGVGIRAYELARALQPHAEVTLAAIESDMAPPSDVELVHYHQRDQKALRPLIARADVVVAQPQWPIVASWLRRSDARLVYDVYDPEPFETFEWLRGRKALLRRTIDVLTLDRYVDALRDGHHFMCASRGQRALWIGTMLGAGLIDNADYDRDSTFLSVIDVVPFGVPAAPPVHTGDGVRARFPQLRDDDEIVLWNGGIWSWLDAPGAVRAAALLAERRPSAKLVFMGAATHGPAKRATEEVRALAAELGVLDTTVLFNDRWVPYERRADWLLEAGCAVSTHTEHLETAFAFRTRLLDCFWAGLPVVCTSGDDLAARVERDGLGATVPERDPVALAGALEAVLERGRDAHAAALARAAQEYAWPRAAAPLVRWALSDEPPARLGSGAARPGAAARSLAYRTARTSLNAVGLREWPKL